ncbi:MAG TPA: hypothetical protein PKE49_18390 [Leptospiraceae bacterium]|jgi:hypothetical protein|nr:hypothetical protein [Leptospirales bacterium]HMX58503.1 hypothetical protein [Leptospiraceae bacterium]HMY46923.1 hypothetical protein [Leptospiraceae bacterium]HMZ37559.1 hypothetical protein [Leptospiraceae bacterium]HNE23703.1 hypothetical protein [Leptospiraceae bacterium]
MRAKMKTRPGILIDEKDRWIYQQAELIQPDILAYFRQNLHRSDRTYFIRNTFGELVEEGELDAVLGFPLHAISAVPQTEDVHFLVDSGERITIPFSAIYLDRDDCFFFEMPGRGVPVRLTASAMTHVSDTLVDTSPPRWSAGVPVSRKSLSEYFINPPAR